MNICKKILIICAFLFFTPIFALACATDKDCPEGFYCYQDPLVGGKCLATKETGTECKNDNECPSGTTCQLSRDGSERHCYAALPVGKYCQEDRDCQSGTCENNICTAFKGEEWPAIVEPNLEVPLPNLKFSNIFATENEQGRFIYIPYLAQYAAALFKWLVAISGILAGMMIVYAGIKWMLASGNPEKINEAKHKVGDAVIGLILVVGSYTILYIINPDLVNFNALRIQTIPKEIFYLENEEESLTPSDVPKNLTNINNDRFTAYIRFAMKDDTMKALQPQAAGKLLEALKKFKDETGQTAVITSATRTYDKQCSLYKENCHTSDCIKRSTSTCSPTTCFPGSDPSKTHCPHVSGQAVDIWCEGGSVAKCCPNGTSVGCSSIATSCPCRQDILEQKMKEAGFCRLKSEIWHFEYPKMSGSCN